MDFDVHFTKEGEKFRKEVRAWLKENFPADLEWPVEPYDVTSELVKVRENLRRKLGAKGWLAPDFSKELGGGGMSEECVAVLHEEIMKAGRGGGAGVLGGFASDIFVGPVLHYGPDKLKKEFLGSYLRGEKNAWLNETEPDHGTDNAAMETTARLDGDDYVINGEKIYIGREDPLDWRNTWLFTPAVTKPGAPRHENLGVFMMPANLPGISCEVLPLIGAEARKHRIFMKNVRVPAKYLIGGPEANGWEVLQFSLRAEHGGGGALVHREPLSSRLISYCKETKRNGKPLSSDPFIQDILIKLWIEDQKERLYGLSTYWMGKTGKSAGVVYKLVQSALHQKVEAPKLAKAILDILGPIAVTSDPELRVLAGEVERAERMGCVTHIAGTPESLKILAARAIGMTRPKEKGGK
jgi:alkylation response protein AidB-like acyl-CoA dehydrogenase